LSLNGANVVCDVHKWCGHQEEENLLLAQQRLWAEHVAEHLAYERLWAEHLTDYI
jgi:hypothetical protein